MLIDNFCWVSWSCRGDSRFARSTPSREEKKKFYCQTEGRKSTTSKGGWGNKIFEDISIV